jgi:hypothetical protein
MRARIQDGFRFLIGISLVWYGRFRRRRIHRSIKNYRENQKGLIRKYRLLETDPVLPHGPDLQSGIDAFASQSKEAVRFAETSGSTGVPKRIAYTGSRLQGVVGTYIDAFARAYVAIPVKRKSLYVMSSLKADNSLTALMMGEKAALPPYFSGLQAPYRLQSDPELQALAATYGSHALRTWVLAISNPGVLYCTNPSTLSTYLDALDSDWVGSTSLVRDWVKEPRAFSNRVRRIARRLSSVGDTARLEEIANAPANLGLLAIAPAVSLFSCWDGGYVRPFLERIRKHLPQDRVRHLPMYSMSTEVIETLPVFEADTPAFLPIASGVRYEFLPVDAEDDASLLKEAWSLKPGDEVLMVVSDAYGLRRYQTEDVFRCDDLVAGLPNLRFLRRRGLAWSFTGEKITGDQVELVFAQMKESTPFIDTLEWMAIVPSQPKGAPLPGYVLLLVGSPLAQDLAAIGEQFDACLSVLNSEFSDKCESQRLAPTRVHCLSMTEYVGRVGGARHQDSWEAQFKFLPLVCKLWEDLSAPVEEV